MVLASLALFLSVHFNGGAPEALAGTLSDAMKVPVIIETSKVVSLKPMDLEVSSLSSVGKSFRKQPLIIQGGVDLVLSDEGYLQSNFTGLLNSPEPGPSVLKIPPGALENGKVTLSNAKGAPVLTGSLADLKWSKPFKISFLLQGLALSVVADGLPETRFLDMVKKAVGAQWLMIEGIRYLVPEPAQLKVRLRNTLLSSTESRDAEPSSSEIQLSGVKERKELFLAAVAGLEDEDLAKLFSAPDGTISCKIIPNSELAQAIVAYIQVLAGEESKQPPGQPKTMSRLLQTVDSRRSAEAKVWANGNFEIQVPTYDPETKQSGITTVQ
jgi:hypothetical protein